MRKLEITIPLTRGTADNWWLHIPSFENPTDLNAWATEMAPKMAANYHLSSRPVNYWNISQFLSTLARIAPREYYPIRMLFSPKIKEGYLLYEFSFCLVEACDNIIETHRRLLGVDEFGGDLGTQTDLIYGDTDQDIIGLQVVRFYHTEPEPEIAQDPDVHQELAYLGCVIRRNDSPGGPVDIVAITDSKDMKLLADSALPLHKLLLSNHLYELGM